MEQQDLLRMVGLRPAQVASGARTVVAAYTDENETAFMRRIVSAFRGNEGYQRLRELADEERARSRHLRSIDDAPLALGALIAWFKSNSHLPLQQLDLSAALASVLGQSPSLVVSEADFDRTWQSLSDALLAASIAGGRRTGTDDDFVIALKLLTLVKDVAEEKPIGSPEQRLGSWLARLLVVLPAQARKPGFVPGSRGTHADEPSEPPPQRPDRGRLMRLEAARAELLRLSADRRAFARRTDDEQREQRRALVRDTRARVEREDTPTDRRGTDAVDTVSTRALHRVGLSVNDSPQRPLFTRRAMERISPESRELLREMDVNEEELDPFEVLPLIERDLASEGRRVAESQPQTRFVKMGKVAIDVSRMREVFKNTAPKPGKSHGKSGCNFNVGIGDLLVVRQRLKAYELADIAHVENVLAGESREREHRRLNLREEVQISEAEQEVHKERDLQSTERNETQAEAEKVIESEFGLEAGLQLSGSYGPTVSFTSNLNVGFSTSTEESQSKLSSYSREVTEKVAERTRERTRKEQRTRVLEQIEEINRHAVENSNAASGHVRGIYRWLNKVYDAQVYNYGQRMMFEFVIPEPAAYFLYALIDNPPGAEEIVKPEAPRMPPSPRPLVPAQLTPSNYQSLVATYEALDVPPPPPATAVVSHFESLDDTGQHQTFGRGTKIAIPPGYSTHQALVSAMQDGGLNTELSVFVGGLWHVPVYDGFTTMRTLQHTFTNEISLTLFGPYLRAYSLGVDLFCTLNDDGLSKWQSEAYEAIMRAYQLQRADYEEKMAAREVQEGIQILGQNPLTNRRIERDELKKLAISMLTDDPDPSFDSFINADEPQIDVDAACDAASFIRFFESAFEWKNMTYVFYPYFWGRKSRWLSALHLTDPDPDFAAFLKAGAARVQVPVRPGFESALSYYCQTGKLWEGNDPPLLQDELFVPIVDEITDNLGKLDDGVVYPAGSEPWEVRVPTSLVLVQDLEEVPGIVDSLTGEIVDIGASTT